VQRRRAHLAQRAKHTRFQPFRAHSATTQNAGWPMPPPPPATAPLAPAAHRPSSGPSSCPPLRQAASRTSAPSRSPSPSPLPAPAASAPPALTPSSTSSADSRRALSTTPTSHSGESYSLGCLGGGGGQLGVAVGDVLRCKRQTL